MLFSLKKDPHVYASGGQTPANFAAYWCYSMDFAVEDVQLVTSWGSHGTVEVGICMLALSCLYLIQWISPIKSEIYAEIQCLKVILYAPAIINTPEVIMFLLSSIDMVLLLLQGFHVPNKHSIHETLDANVK